MTNCYIQTDLPDETPIKCDNCGWEGTLAQAEEICDIQERIEPGGEVPAGQCPEDDCGALCYLAKPEQKPAPDRTLELLQWMTRCPSIQGPAGTTAYIIKPEVMEAARDHIERMGYGGNTPALLDAAKP